MNRSVTATLGALVLISWLSSPVRAQYYYHPTPNGWPAPAAYANPVLPTYYLPVMPVAYQAPEVPVPKADPPAADLRPTVAFDNNAPARSDESRVQAVFFGGFDGFRQIVNGIVSPIGSTNFQDNFGLHAGTNVGIGLIDSWGLGVQGGFRYIGADWDGRSDNIAGPDEFSFLNQFFFTTGFYKRADRGARFTAALVIDFLFDDNLGVFSTEPHLHQWRALLGVPLGDRNEIGFWGAQRDGTSTQQVTDLPGFDILTYSAVSRYSFYWKHLFDGGAEATLWSGFFDGSRHGLAPGSLGSWSIGLDVEAPISDRISLYADFAYMKPSGSSGGSGFNAGAVENAFNISFGLAFYPCFNLRNRCSISDRGWLPALPVANNGTFLVDYQDVFVPPPVGPGN